MESIVIFKATGGENLLLTPQKGIDLHSVTQTKKIMEQDTITIDLMSVIPLDIGVGDYLRNEKGAITHRLITPPEIEKIDSRKYSYHLTFEGAIYELNNFIYTNQGDSKEELLPSSEFYFTGELKDFLLLLQRSANKYDSEIDNPYSWVVMEDSIPQTNVKTLNFNNESCLSALKKIADAFKVEFDVIFKTENNDYEWRFLKVLDYQSDNPLRLKYGKYYGLRSLRKTSEKETRPNVLRYYGAKKNLPPLYRDRHGKIASRLLPNGVDEPMIMDGWIDQIEMIIEKNHFFDDIFPQYLGSITGTGRQSADILQFSDYKIDFSPAPINDNTKMKINFKTGNLAGYTFDIREVQAGGNITIEPKKDDNGVSIPNNDTPNSPFMWAVGDEFVFIDVQMPEKYIRKAEERLAQMAEKDFERRQDEDLSQIEISLYEPYFKRKQLQITTNNFLTLEDNDLNISDTYRVLKVTTEIVRNNKFNPYNTKVELEKWNPKPIEIIESAAPSIQILANATQLPAYVVGDSFTFEKLEDYLHINILASDRWEDDRSVYYQVLNSSNKVVFTTESSDDDFFYIKPKGGSSRESKSNEFTLAKDDTYTIKAYYNYERNVIVRKLKLALNLSMEQSSVEADLFIYQCGDNQINYKDCELRKDNRVALYISSRRGALIVGSSRKQYNKVMLNFGDYFKSSGSYKWKIVRDDGRIIVDTISHTDFYYIKDGDSIDGNFFKVGNSYTVYCQFRGGKKPMTSLANSEDIVLKSHFTIVQDGFRKGAFK